MYEIRNRAAELCEKDKSEAKSGGGFQIEDLGRSTILNAVEVEEDEVQEEATGE
jgi:hypothetical protein